MNKVLTHRWIQLLLGFGLSVGLIIWLAFAINWGEVADKIKDVNYFGFLLVTLVITLHFALRAYRWHFLLPETQSKASFANLFGSIMVGNFATYILPLRAGEFVRPFLLTRLSSHSFSTGLASVVIERFLDLSMVLISFAWTINQVPGLPTWVHQSAYILAGLALALLFFIVIGIFFPSKILALVSFFCKPLPEKFKNQLLSFVNDLLKSSRVVATPLNLLRVIVLTVLVWLSCYGIFYSFFSLFQMNYSWLISVTTAVIVALAVAAPSAPGFVGVYQTACIAAFGLFGLSKEDGAAYSIISHVYQYIFFTLAAVIFLSIRQIKVSEIVKKPK